MNVTESNTVTETFNPFLNTGQYLFMQETNKIFADNLKRLRGSRKQKEFSEFLGLNQPTYSRYERGKIPRMPDLTKIAHKFGLTPEKLLAPMTPEPPNARFEKASERPKTRLIPVVSFAAAGHARNYEDLANQLDEMVETDTRDENAFAIILEGNSMVPEFKPGDRVVFAPGLMPRNGDAAVVKLKDSEEILFKWFYETGRNGELIKLVSENKDYEDVIIPREKVQFVYPAWETKRRNRR